MRLPLLPGVTSRPREWVARLALVAFGLGAMAAGIETITWALFHWPGVWRGRAPSAMETLLVRYRTEYLMGVPIQFQPECAEPDPSLYYRLRAGDCRFRTDEFDTHIHGSQRHLREDVVLRDPEIVVLGDSFAMGWGVEREQAFPAVVGRRLGKRVTVAAMSSYGTVRELLLLESLALEDFDRVLIQYCDNDLAENRAFLEAGGYEPSPASTWFHWVAVERRIQEKRFLPRSRHWFSLFWSDAFGPTPARQAPATAQDHARAFLEVLRALAGTLRGRPVSVFPVGMGEGGADFIRAVNRAAPVTGLGPLRAFSATHSLGDGDIFRVDPHWRAEGHRKVASTVVEALATARSSGTGNQIRP